VSSGAAEPALGKLDEALTDYRDGLPIIKALVAQDPSNTEHQLVLLQGYANGIGNLAYYFVLARNFGTALKAADQAIALAPQLIFLYGNRAHALMFLDRVEEARTLYLKYRGQKNVVGDKSWEAVVLEDLSELRKAGLSHPLMGEIESTFNTNG
jgi:tetratricopeptide (TPR) repeat protein